MTVIKCFLCIVVPAPPVPLPVTWAAWAAALGTELVVEVLVCSTAWSPATAMLLLVLFVVCYVVVVIPTLTPVTAIES